MFDYSINSKQAMALARLAAIHGIPMAISTAQPSNPNATVYFGSGKGTFSITPKGETIHTPAPVVESVPVENFDPVFNR